MACSRLNAKAKLYCSNHIKVSQLLDSLTLIVNCTSAIEASLSFCNSHPSSSCSSSFQTIPVFSLLFHLVGFRLPVFFFLVCPPTTAPVSSAHQCFYTLIYFWSWGLSTDASNYLWTVQEVLSVGNHSVEMQRQRWLYWAVCSSSV